MGDVLQDGSPVKLIAAMEENLSAFLPVFGKLGESYVNDPAGVKRSITDIPFPLVNSVMDARLTPEGADAAIESVISDAGARNVPVLWWIGPSTRPADLGKRLEEHGFAHSDEAPGMAIDLAALKEILPKPEGLSFRVAQDDATRREWSSTMAAGFEIPSSAGFVVDAWCDLLRLADPGTTLAYSAALNGKAVATSLLFLAAGVAGIYAVATVPEARRKGIGAQVTLYALKQARSAGYRFGVLQSSDMGLSVYRSLGFEQYCIIEMYRWGPEKTDAG